MSRRNEVLLRDYPNHQFVAGGATQNSMRAATVTSDYTLHSTPAFSVSRRSVDTSTTRFLRLHGLCRSRQIPSIIARRCQQSRSQSVLPSVRRSRRKSANWYLRCSDHGQRAVRAAANVTRGTSFSSVDHWSLIWVQPITSLSTIWMIRRISN